ncbi:MAG TPA: hypothetical protein PLB62_01350 [Candidatus Sumerlaeota bacterium]|nr:hypothetical protein [Candidatus Sumerlaeota bacterium]
MNKISSVLLLMCGVIIIVTQAMEMLNGQPILLITGCVFFLGGLIGLIRAKPGTRADRHD